jgi:hypothetical protein
LENAQNVLGWLIGSVATSVISLIAVIITIVKSGIMLPKEIEGADLNNRKTEADILEKMQGILEKSIDKSAEWQIKFDKLDCEARETRDKLEKITEQYDLQDQKLIEQNNRIIALESLSESQKKEIIELTAEVNNYYLWTNALVKQLEKAELKPVKMEEVEGFEPSIVKSSKKKVK